MTPKPSSETLAALLQANKARILVVDDDLHICSGLKDILQDTGYEVEIATCAADANDLLESQTFGIMVVDYALPDANGIEIARLVRREYPWLQCILMTGHDRVEIADTDDGSPLLAAFLRKPIDVQSFLGVVEQTLHRQCDRYHVKRFSPHTGEIPTAPIPVPPVEPPKVAAKPVKVVVDEKPLKPSASYALFFIVLGFAAGTFARPYLVLLKEIYFVTREHVMIPAVISRPAPADVSSDVLVQPVSSPHVQASVAEAVAPASPARVPTPQTPVLLEPEKPKPVVPNWERLLTSADPLRRVQAAKALLKINPAHQKAAAALLSLMNDPDGSRRLMAIEAISVSGLSTPAIISALAKALSDEIAVVSSAAASTLAHVGSAAVPALPQLIDAMVDDSPARSSTSKLARSTIMRLGKEAVPELIAKVSDPDTRADVVDLLGAMGPDADDAVPLLTSLQQDPDIGEAAIQALALIRPQPQ